MTADAEEAVRRLGARLCPGCLGHDCYGCKRSTLVRWITSGDNIASIRPARLWIERMEGAGFTLEKNTNVNFATVARASRRRERPALPYDDHRFVWRKRHAGLLYTSQPYMDWSDVDKRERLGAMKDTCQAYGLKMLVSDEMSWWFPKRTTMVVIGTADVLREARFDC